MTDLQRARRAGPRPIVTADGRGRNAALWPGMSVGYWMAMRTAAIAAYVPAPAAAVAGGATASRRVA